MLLDWQTMSGLEALGLVLLFALLPVVWLSRANELFVIDVVEGRIVGGRGRVPSRLVSEIRDILSRPPVGRIRIRVVSEDRRPHVVVKGSIPDAQAQQLRNVVGLWTVGQLRTAPRLRISGSGKKG